MMTPIIPIVLKKNGPTVCCCEDSIWQESLIWSVMTLDKFYGVGLSCAVGIF